MTREMLLDNNQNENRIRKVGQDFQTCLSCRIHNILYSSYVDIVSRRITPWRPEPPWLMVDEPEAPAPYPCP